MCVVAVGGLSGGTAMARTMPSFGQAAPSATLKVPRYGVFERTFRWSSAGYSNPWEQVGLTMSLTSPSGRKMQVGGFYYGPNTWKIRFAPGDIGRWRWTAAIHDQRRHGS